MREEKRWLRHGKINPDMPNLCRQSLSGSNSAVLLLFSLFVITSYNEQIHEYTCRKQQQHLPFVPVSVQ